MAFQIFGQYFLHGSIDYIVFLSRSDLLIYVNDKRPAVPKPMSLEGS